jgi:hypothetical protein
MEEGECARACGQCRVYPPNANRFCTNLMPIDLLSRSYTYYCLSASKNTESIYSRRCRSLQSPCATGPGGRRGHVPLLPLFPVYLVDSYLRWILDGRLGGEKEVK